MRFCAAALTLAFALGVAGYASAEESGNWLTRWFTSAAPKTETDKAAETKDGAKATMPPAVSRAVRLAKKAEADWGRRTEVLNKLRGIALDSGDDELLRTVEQLDQRAWDLYTASSNARSQWDQPAPEPDAKKGKRK